MTRWVSRSAGVVAAVLAGVAVSALPQAIGSPSPVVASPSFPAAPAAGMDRYADPVNGWSISYPAGWLVDAADPARVEIHDPENLAVVSISVMPADLLLNAFANKMVGSDVIKRRELIALPNGIPAVDIRAEIAPDQRSHQLYLIAAGKAFEVKGQASAAAWEGFSADFTTMLNSFTPPASQ